MSQKTNTQTMGIQWKTFVPVKKFAVYGERCQTTRIKIYLKSVAFSLSIGVLFSNNAIQRIKIYEITNI